MAPYFSLRVPNFFFANYCNFPSPLAAWLFVRDVRDKHRVLNQNASRFQQSVDLQNQGLCKSFLIKTATSLCQDKFSSDTVKSFFPEQRICFLIKARPFSAKYKDRILFWPQNLTPFEVSDLKNNNLFAIQTGVIHPGNSILNSTTFFVLFLHTVQVDRLSIRKLH